MYCTLRLKKFIRLRCCNVDMCEPVLMVFDRNVTDKAGNQRIALFSRLGFFLRHSVVVACYNCPVITCEMYIALLWIGVLVFKSAYLCVRLINRMIVWKIVTNFVLFMLL